MKKLHSGLWPKFMFVVLAALCAFGCNPKSIEIKVTSTDNACIASVNGEKITCSIEKTSIAKGEEIVLECTSETDYDVTIDIAVNGMKVGTVSSFPAEFRYEAVESGTYQVAISGTVQFGNKLSNSYATFFNEWNIIVE